MHSPLIAARLRLLRFWPCQSHRAGAATIRSSHFATLSAYRAFDRWPAWQRMQGYSIREQAQLIYLPNETKRSRCCSIRVPSRILSDIIATSLVVSSGILCIRSGKRADGNLARRPSVRARPVTVNRFILEKGNTPLMSPACAGSETVSPPNSPLHWKSPSRKMNIQSAGSPCRTKVSPAWRQTSLT